MVQESLWVAMQECCCTEGNMSRCDNGPDTREALIAVEVGSSLDSVDRSWHADKSGGLIGVGRPAHPDARCKRRRARRPKLRRHDLAVEEAVGGRMNDPRLARATRPRAALRAVATVSPASAAEHEQHEENNQQGSHVYLFSDEKPEDRRAGMHARQLASRYSHPRTRVRPQVCPLQNRLDADIRRSATRQRRRLPGRGRPSAEVLCREVPVRQVV